jgi:hypothetical protein
MNKILMLLFATFLLMSTVFPLRVSSAVIPIIYVNPPEIYGLSVGENFSIDVVVANVSNLYAWSIQLCYKSNVLNASRWDWGPVFKPPDIFNVTVAWTDNYNETHGLIQIDCTFFGDAPTFNGTTTLFTVYFKVKSLDFTLLHLQNTRLFNNLAPLPEEMPHVTADGMVRLGLVDVSVTGITLSKNVANDTVVKINVTVKNFGTLNVTFNVTLYYDLIEIGIKAVNDLASLSVAEINFEWDTTPVPKGKYTIIAKVPVLEHEENPDDNVYVDGTVVETIKGDVNGDFKVDIHDIFEFAKAYDTEPGDPRWKPNCDLDNDGLINVRDLFYAARNFGKEI